LRGGEGGSLAFTAGTYSDMTLWGVAYKTVLVTAQVLGYRVSGVDSPVSPKLRVNPDCARFYKPDAQAKVW
jgi:hypothetical protein